jgi:hypothetical protein
MQLLVQVQVSWIQGLDCSSLSIFLKKKFARGTAWKERIPFSKGLEPLTRSFSVARRQAEAICERLVCLLVS